MDPIQNPVLDATSSPVPNPTPVMKLEPIGATLKQSWAVFKQHMNLFLYTSGLMAGALVVWALMVTPNPKAQPEDLAASMPMFFAGIILLIVLGLFSQLMMTILALRRTESWTFQSLFKAVTPKIGGYIVLSILTGLAVFVGMFLFVLPGIYLAVALSFGSYVYLDQGTSATDSLSKSRELVKGLWWPVFGRFVVLVIIFMVVSVIVTVPFGQASKIGGVANALVSLVLMPAATVYFVLIYEQLKKIKTGV